MELWGAGTHKTPSIKPVIPLPDPALMSYPGIFYNWNEHKHSIQSVLAVLFISSISTPCTENNEKTFVNWKLWLFKISDNFALPSLTSRKAGKTLLAKDGNGEIRHNN